MKPPAMKRVVLALAASFSLAAACGGRSTLDLAVIELRTDGGASDAQVLVDGAPSDAPGDAPADGAKDGPTQDAISITTLVPCGTEACYPSTEECCVQMGAGARCTLKGQCQGVPLTCTGSNTCPTGDVCCFSFGGGQPSASCSASCGGGGRGGGSFQLCAAPSDCPNGEPCVQTPFGVQVCLPGRGGGGPTDAGAGG